MMGVGITTAVWFGITMITRPADKAVLQAFYDRVRPFERGWRKAVRTRPDEPGSVAAAVLAWVFGCVTVYAALFATGMALYGRSLEATAFGAVVVLTA